MTILKQSHTSALSSASVPELDQSKAAVLARLPPRIPVAPIDMPSTGS